MAAFYKVKGNTLRQFKNSIYEKYGYFFNRFYNYAFEGAGGMQEMGDYVDKLGTNPPKELKGK